MPNICFATLQVTGMKSSIEEFAECLEADYNYRTMEFSHKPHFFRVFEVDRGEMNFIEGLIYTQTFYINCAWSIYSCMMEGPFSYYNSIMVDNIKEGKENFATHLVAISRDLKLDIEVWSNETGMCFAEHIHIRNGEILDNICYEYTEHYIEEYETYNDYVEDWGEPFFDEEKFNDTKDKGYNCIEECNARNFYKFKVQNPDGYSPFAEQARTMCDIVKDQ